MFSSSERKSARTEQLSSASSVVIKLWPCPGLTGADNERITQYLGRTQSASGGGVSERKLADEMFRKAYSQLDLSQKKAVMLRQLQTHRWRNDHLRQRIFAIGEKSCHQNVEASEDTEDHSTVKPCSACKDLLSLPAFLTATTKSQPEDKNRAFIPHRFQNTAIGKMQMKTLGFANLLSEMLLLTVYFQDSDESMMSQFARAFAEGRFEKNQVFLDMINVMILRSEREKKGRGMQNMHYPPAFDEW
ncbi:hypothetical protein HYPSUDRAFT_152102, partial [Hypholoma sublateritium FD-334 SS-4]